MLGRLLGLEDANLDEAIKIARDLAKPYPGEDTSLPVHNQLCGRRFETLVVLVVASINKSRSNSFLLYVIIFLLLATNVLTIDKILSALRGLI